MTNHNTLRVALVGKGGAGKSVMCGTLARIFARRGRRVLALDVDTLPGLALSLGLPLDEAGDAGLPEDLGERQAVIDHEPNAPAVAAIRELVRRLETIA